MERLAREAATMGVVVAVVVAAAAVGVDEPGVVGLAASATASLVAAAGFATAGSDAVG